MFMFCCLSTPDLKKASAALRVPETVELPEVEFYFTKRRVCFIAACLLYVVIVCVTPLHPLALPVIISEA